MKFCSFVRIDSFDDLTSLEEAISLGEVKEYPFSEQFVDYETSDDGEEIIKIRKEEFVPGIYFVWYEESWDRAGDFIVKLLIPVPEKVSDAKIIAERIKALIDENAIIGENFEKWKTFYHNQSKTGNQTPPKVELKDEDFDRHKEIQKELSKLGFSYF